MYHSETVHGIEDYKQEILDRLVRLRQENPFCWGQMRLQIDEQSGARELSRGGIIHWLDESGFKAGRRN